MATSSPIDSLYYAPRFERIEFLSRFDHLARSRLLARVDRIARLDRLDFIASLDRITRIDRSSVMYRLVEWMPGVTIATVATIASFAFPFRSRRRARPLVRSDR